jgi:hypothetical protein
MIQDPHWPSLSRDPGKDVDIPADSVMVIRTWCDPGQPQSFRARILYGRIPGTSQDAVVTADPAEVLIVVQEWLVALPGASGLPVLPVPTAQRQAQQNSPWI